MILNGYTVPTRCASLNPKPCLSHLEPKRSVSSWMALPLATISTTWRLSSGSSPVFVGDQGSLLRAVPLLPSRPRRLGSRTSPRAAKEASGGFKYPPMMRKPRWWWRALACLPYLMPLHETWMYAETAYQLHSFLESLELMTYPFLEALGTLPRWFLIAYFFVGYLCVIRRKEWPHFIRFHLVMGMLLEIWMQVVGSLSKLVPTSLYWSKLGMHFWAAFAFAHLFTCLECMRCALSGMYADVPYFSDAAYIQIPYDQ